MTLFSKQYFIITVGKMIYASNYDGIYNSCVIKPSYKTELRIMTSQAKLLTLKFYFFKSSELVTPCEKNFNMNLELVTRYFLKKINFQSY